MSYLIGRHLSLNDNLEKIIKENGFTVVQIFTKSPQQINYKTVDLHSYSYLKKMPLMFIHGSYVINFSNPIKSLLFRRSVKNLIEDLVISEYINSVGVVIHMGRNVEKNHISDLDSMQNYVQGLKIVISKTSKLNSLIILETGASQGKEIGSKIIDMAKIYHSLTKDEKSRIGFCIDTCHIWATGYDISSEKNVQSYLELFDKEIGLKKVVCVQFNDSVHELGSKKDRHEDLGKGSIPKKGLKAMARWAHKNKIPLIMETPLRYHEMNDEINIVKKWIKI